MYPEMNMTRYPDLIMSYKDELIEGVNETRQICKGLLNQGLLSEDEYRVILAAPSPQLRTKQILHALSTQGQRGSNALYRLLQEHEPELTLQLEHALYVHTMKQKLIQSVKQVEPVANKMVNQDLITKEEYLQVCEEEGSEARMHAMFQVLEQNGMKQSDGFYNMLFHCEPLLYRELEKDRVIQMYELHKETQFVHLVSEENVEKRWKELELKENELNKEKEKLRREWDLLKKQQAELEKERKQTQQELKKIQTKWNKNNANVC